MARPPAPDNGLPIHFRVALQEARAESLPFEAAWRLALEATAGELAPTPREQWITVCRSCRPAWESAYERRGAEPWLERLVAAAAGSE